MKSKSAHNSKSHSSKKKTINHSTVSHSKPGNKTDFNLGQLEDVAQNHPLTSDTTNQAEAKDEVVELDLNNFGGMNKLGSGKENPEQNSETSEEVDSKFKRPEIPLDPAIITPPLEVETTNPDIDHTNDQDNTAIISDQAQEKVSDEKVNPISENKDSNTNDTPKPQINELEQLWESSQKTTTPAAPVNDVHFKTEEISDNHPKTDGKNIQKIEPLVMHDDHVVVEDVKAQENSYIYTPQVIQSNPPENQKELTIEHKDVDKKPDKKLEKSLKLANKANNTHEEHHGEEEQATIDDNPILPQHEAENEDTEQGKSEEQEQKDPVLIYADEKKLKNLSDSTNNGSKIYYLVFFLLGVFSTFVVIGCLYFFKDQLNLNLPLLNSNMSSSQLQNDVNYNLTDTKISTKSAKLASPSAKPAEKTINRSTITIRVLNGSKKSGVANTVSTKLKDLGYKIDSIGNATNSAFPQTIIRMKAQNSSVSSQLIKDLSPEYKATSSSDLKNNSSYDIEVVIGKI